MIVVVVWRKRKRNQERGCVCVWKESVLCCERMTMELVT